MKTIVAWLMASAIVAAQTPARDATMPTTEGTGTISGVVLSEGDAPAPIRMARVELTSGPSSFRARIVMTDDSGRFAFTRLPEGRFNISANKPGFIAANYGAKRLGGPGVPIVLAAGEHARADLALLRSAAITGTIRGPDGQPAVGVRVTAYEYDVTSDGARSLQPRTSGNSRYGPLITDERGMYRIYNLKPGEYYLAAVTNNTLAGTQTSAQLVEWAQRAIAAPPETPLGTPPTLRSQALASVFFPGVIDPSLASPIPLAAGQEAGGIDLTLSYVPTSTISGTVTGPDGQPPAIGQMSLQQQPMRPFGFAGAGDFIRPSADGSFSASGVLPGEYKLVARGSARAADGAADPTTGTAAMPLWAMLDLNVTGEDITGLDLKLAPGMTVSGQLAFDATTEKPPADVTKITVSLQPMQTSRVMSMPGSAARVNADGTFALHGAGPGLYRLTTNLGQTGLAGTWSVRSSVVRGADTLDEPFELRDQSVAGAIITLTDHAPQLSGSLLDASGRPAPEYFVVVFPVDRKFWVPQSRRVRSVRPGTTGKFTVNALPPGDYYVCALTDVENNRLSTPEFLEPLIPAGIRISLADGEKKTQDLKVAARAK